MHKSSDAGPGQEEERRLQIKPKASRVSLPLRERRVLLLLVDTLVVGLAVLCALRLWAFVAGRNFSAGFVRARWFWFPVLITGWCLVAWFGDLYELTAAGRRREAERRVVGCVLGLGGAYLIAYFVLPRDALPRLFFAYFAALTFIGMSAWRCIYATLFGHPALSRRVLIVGAGQAGSAFAQMLAQRQAAGLKALGFIDDDPSKQGTIVAGLPVLGTSRDMRSLLTEYHIDEAVLAVTHGVRSELFQALTDCRAMGVPVIRMPDRYEQLTRRVPVEHISEGWVLDELFGLLGLAGAEKVIKRVVDVLFGFIGLVLLVLLLPLLAVATWLDDGGPILYTQERVGQDGRRFRVVKFRTMRSDAEGDGLVRWAEPNDERVTRVGRMMRRTRLDELPQVINVLRGEMSIVGPRPERPEFIERLEKEIPFYRTRLVVKPGLTGWAQIHYGYGSSVEDALVKLQYDLYYIRNWSLWRDLYIVIRTVGVVARFGGT